MKISNITAIVLVKNEERWVWFAIMSVIEYVDKLIIFDTGSTDDTCKIINEIINQPKFTDKIIFEQLGSLDKLEFTKAKQRQLDMVNTKWFFVLDGDEIWYKDDLIKAIKHCNITSATMLATKFHNCIRDVYHYSLDERGGYNIKGVKGNITLKFIRKEIPGLRADGPYGVEGFVDETGNEIQNNEDNIEILESKFFHTSHLVRSKNIYHDWIIPYRRIKVFEKPDGKVPKDFRFPEVFDMQRPSFIADPYANASLGYHVLKVLALPYKILIKAKRIFNNES